MTTKEMTFEIALHGEQQEEDAFGRSWFPNQGRYQAQDHQARLSLF